MDKLKRALEAGLVIFDGAMGTEIYRRNLFVNASYEELNLSRPDVIREIHRAYFEAGAEVLTTNTFNANSRALGRFGFADRTAEINRAGVALAREIAGDKALVAASIGPVGAAADPDDRRSAVELISEQLAALGEADFVIFESIRRLPELEAALEAIRAYPLLPYVVSFALEAEQLGTSDDPLEGFLAAVRGATAHRPTAIGLNCGGGPEAVLAGLEELMPLASRQKRWWLPVIVQPNAGAPHTVDGRTLYLTSDEYFSTYARRYAQLGAAAIGGCCGITPEHIAELVRSVKPIADSERRKLPDVAVKELPPPAPLAERSPLGAKFAAGEFVTEVELTLPRGFDLTRTLAAARRCREAGVDVVNLPDGPRASARISPLAAAIAIERETGMATLPHCCTRDRSLIGLQAELLGYAGSGIRNLLFITGDPPKLGDYPFSTGVFDTDAIGLVRLQDRMNRGVDLGGNPLSAPTSVVIGVGADPSAIDPEREYRRLAEKVEAGADFIVTQPVFDAEALFAFLDRIAWMKKPVVAGIWPFASMRNAEFMHSEVPGVKVPEAVMEEMRRAGDDRDDQREAGIRIARRLAADVHARVQGLQVSAPFGNVELALKVLA